MNPSGALSASDRFALCVDALIRAVAARISGGMAASLIVLICGRLRRIDNQMQALVLRIRAGTVRIGPVRGRDLAQRSRRGRGLAVPSLRLQRRFGWLLPLVPCEAAGVAAQLRCLLQDPEMASLLAASPRMVALLRPLCRMLGLEVTLLAPRSGEACNVATTVEMPADRVTVDDVVLPASPLEAVLPASGGIGAASRAVTWRAFLT